MKNFILGLLFVCLGIPLFQDITSIAATQTEYINYTIAKKIYLIKKEIEDSEEQEPLNTKHPIGFQSPAIGFEATPDQEEYQDAE